MIYSGIFGSEYEWNDLGYGFGYLEKLIILLERLRFWIMVILVWFLESNRGSWD